MNKDNLTPIEKIDNIYFKREDKFILNNVNGGKLRQALCLIEKNLDKIRKEFNSTVVCSCSNCSPQSAIISEVCKLYGLKCKIVTFKTTILNRNLSIAQSNSAELYGTTVGWNSVIKAKSKLLKGFNIKMGFASEDIIESNISQVENIPDDLDYLIIPCGSGYNTLSIFEGLKRYGKRVAEVIIVYVGKDPTETLQSLDSYNQKYTLVQSPLSYSTKLKKYPFLDEIYEAKAYDWAINNLQLNDKKVCFWIIGKRNEEFPFQTIKWIPI